MMKEATYLDFAKLAIATPLARLLMGLDLAVAAAFGQRYTGRHSVISVCVSNEVSQTLGHSD